MVISCDKIFFTGIKIFVLVHVILAILVIIGFICVHKHIVIKIYLVFSLVEISVSRTNFILILLYIIVRIYSIILGVLVELVLPLDKSWTEAMRACISAGQAPIFPGENSTIESWVGKAKYNTSLGKVPITHKYSLFVILFGRKM